MKIKGLLAYEKQVDRYVIYGDDGRHRYFLTQGGLGLAEIIEASVPVRQVE